MPCYEEHDRRNISALLGALESAMNSDKSKLTETNALLESFLAFLSCQYVGFQKLHDEIYLRDQSPQSTHSIPFRFSWVILTPDGYPIIGLPGSLGSEFVQHGNPQASKMSPHFTFILDMLQNIASTWQSHSFAMHSQAILQSSKIRDLEKDSMLEKSGQSGNFRVGQHAAGAILSVISSVLFEVETKFGKPRRDSVSQGSQSEYTPTTQRNETELLIVLIDMVKVLSDFLYYAQAIPQTFVHETKLSKISLQVHSALRSLAEWLLSKDPVIQRESDALKSIQIIQVLLRISKAICFRYRQGRARLHDAPKVDAGGEPIASLRDRSSIADECTEDLLQSAEKLDHSVDRSYAIDLRQKCLSKAKITMEKVALIIHLKAELLFDRSLPDDLCILPELISPNGVLWSSFLRCLLSFPDRHTKNIAISLVEQIFLKEFVRTDDIGKPTDSGIQILMIPSSQSADPRSGIPGPDDGSLLSYASAHSLFLDSYEFSGKLCFLQYADQIQDLIDSRYYFSSNVHDIHKKVLSRNARVEDTTPQSTHKDRRFPFAPPKVNQTVTHRKPMKSGTYTHVPFYPDMLFPVASAPQYPENAISLAVLNSLRLMHMHPDSDKRERIEKIECTLKRCHKFLLRSPVEYMEMTRPLMYYLMSFGKSACWQTIFMHRSMDGRADERSRRIEALFDAHWPAVGCRTVIAMPNGKLQEESLQTEFLFHPMSANAMYTTYTKTSPNIIVTQGRKVIASIDSVDKLKAQVADWGMEGVYAENHAKSSSV